MSTEKEFKLTAKEIWDNAIVKQDVFFDSHLGIGLPEGKKFGYIIVGVDRPGAMKPFDCSPNVNEYIDVCYDKDIYYGYSEIKLYARSSVDGKNWTPWYSSLKEVPIKQIIQFKFELYRE